jgi:DDE family transposase
MAVQVRPLIEVLRELPEARKRRGIRHPQAALLALACAAMLCGRTSYGQIAAWGRSYGRAQRALVDALGFTHPILPCEVTFYHLFRKLDIGAFERALAAWAAPILAATAPRSGAADGLAIDGKWLRGSAKRGAPGAQLLAAVSHRLQQTLGQVAVAGGDEVGAGRTLLADLLLEGRVLTMDALFTQGDLAQTVVEGGGDYVMVVKGNQPALHEAIATVFTAPPPGVSRRGSATSSTTKGTVASNGAC